jgi:murein DD-endopeptidase MepM/ murein hydrolase activator NlpD
VKKGETLYGLAVTYDQTVQRLAEINNLRSPYIIRVGQKIFIPHAIEPRRMDPPTGGEPEQAVEDYSGLLAWPVKGEVISDFGIRDRIHHRGIMIAAAKNTLVKAAGDGRVGHVGPIEEFGNVVIIEHANRIVTVYAHLKKSLVQRGDMVMRGDPVGLVGDTGRADRSALYFEVRSRSRPRNPLFFLSKSKAHNQVQSQNH